MSDGPKSDTSTGKLFRANEAVLFLGLSVASYIYTFSNQRAYLRTFGIDETFVSVEVDAIVRAGVGLVAFLLLFINFLHLPSIFYSKSFQIIYVFRVSILFIFAFFLPVFRYSGVNWWSVTFFVVGMLAFSVALFSLIRSYLRGGTLSSYFEEELGIQKQLLKKAADQKIVDLIGDSMWLAIIFVTIIPYAAGLLVGTREGNGKTDFLEFQDDAGHYIVVHRVTDVFLAVGYDFGEDLTPILDGRIMFLQPEDIANQTLERRRFDTDLLRSLPPERQSFSEWYESEIRPLLGPR
ncbi:hypothetical protein [Maritimibacter sp. DP1N21-5]|uniref:hypothetical protein n=1 Tax=Maritimibacter sp. DP1N21-5 TaxID=2836867 RepID=UPI001C43FABC|nr:hypothetical protein [Maritimibacter sp. DP1N21-5]MBV7409626.1 hypothetical protein [Maritimibacter sp. DP1N21-5]